jgi:hypothetical protein
MTREQRILFTFQDIQTVCFQCKKCGAKRGFAPRNWKNIPIACDNCAHPWFKSLSFEEETIKAMAIALEKFVQIPVDGLGCTMRLEFDGLAEDRRKT